MTKRLVDLGLAKVLDDTGAILEAVAGLGTAERLAALDDAGVASQSSLGDTAESAATGLATGDAATGTTVGLAGVLLDGGVGDTAGSLGDGAAGVLAAEDDGVARGVADTLGVGDGSRGEGGEAEDNGGDGELHFESGFGKG